MDKKRDYIGQELKVGDKVVFMQVKYRGLLTGTIISMTNQTAVIEHKKTNLGNTTTRQYYSQIVKHPDQ